MSKSNINPCEVVTGKHTVFSYLNVNEPKAPLGGGTPKYSVSLIIPKSDTVTIDKIKAAIKAAFDEGQSKLKGSSKVAPSLQYIKLPLRDGDKDRKGDDAYKDCYFLNANSTNKPRVVDASVNDILDTSELYSGIKGRAYINFYAFNSNGNRGIAVGLNGLQKLSDGTPLGGRKNVADVFASFDDDEDDEDFLS